jgi:hypothetical protein
MVPYKNPNNADFKTQEPSKQIVVESFITVYQQDTGFFAIYPVVLCRSVCAIGKFYQNNAQ